MGGDGGWCGGWFSEWMGEFVVVGPSKEEVEVFLVIFIELAEIVVGEDDGVLDVTREVG